MLLRARFQAGQLNLEHECAMSTDPKQVSVLYGDAVRVPLLNLVSVMFVDQC